MSPIYNTSHLNIKFKKMTALIQCKIRYKDSYIQLEECKSKNNKQTNKQTFEFKIINVLSPIYQK